ncbi:MAG: hypothetical protein OHK0039_07580 [Bacteroidia bacterium]
MRTNKLFLAVAVLGISLMSCNQDKLKQLEAENQALLQERRIQDSLLNDFASTFNTFEDNLAKIKERENLISMEAGGPEFKEENKGKILDDLHMIDELLAQNRLIIDDLSKKAEQSDAQSSQLRRSIASFKKKLEEHDKEIVALREQLTTLNFTVEELNVKVSDLTQYAEQLDQENQSQTARIVEQDSLVAAQTRTIGNQREELNTAYYVIGSSRELKEKSIVVKSKLNQDADVSAFTRIDISQTNSISLGDTKSVDLLTTHPSDSYALVDDNSDKRMDRLEIKDPARFWKASRYLVLVAN